MEEVMSLLSKVKKSKKNSDIMLKSWIIFMAEMLTSITLYFFCYNNCNHLIVSDPIVYKFKPLSFRLNKEVLNFAPA